MPKKHTYAVQVLIELEHEAPIYDIRATFLEQTHHCILWAGFHQKDTQQPVNAKVLSVVKI